MHNGQKTRIAISRAFHLSDVRRPEPDYAKTKILNLTQKATCPLCLRDRRENHREQCPRASFYYYARLPSAAR